MAEKETLGLGLITGGIVPAFAPAARRDPHLLQDRSDVGDERLRLNLTVLGNGPGFLAGVLSYVLGGALSLRLRLQGQVGVGGSATTAVRL